MQVNAATLHIHYSLGSSVRNGFLFFNDSQPYSNVFAAIVNAINEGTMYNFACNGDVLSLEMKKINCIVCRKDNPDNRDGDHCSMEFALKDENILIQDIPISEKDREDPVAFMAATTEKCKEIGEHVLTYSDGCNQTVIINRRHLISVHAKLS